MQRARVFVSNVLAIAYKEAALLRHDKTVVQNVVLQPIIMLLVFGFALSFKPQDTPWAVLDRSDTALSRRLIAEIETSGYFLPPTMVTSYDAGRALLKSGEATALVVIPEDLRRDAERGHPRVQLLLDGTDPLTAARVGAYITQIAGRITERTPPERRVAGGVVDDAATGGIALRQQFRFNPTLRDLDFYLSAMAGFLLTNLCLAAASLGLVAERENGTYEQLLAQPTRPIEVVLGKLVPNVVTSYAALILAQLGAGFFYGYWPKGSMALLAIVTLPFILATLSIGVFVSALARTSAQAVFISVFFIMPSFVLSGSMLPYQLMPHGVREVGGFFPLRWYQIISRRIIERGASFGEVAIPTLVLLALFAGMLMLIRWRMKPRLA